MFLRAQNGTPSGTPFNRQLAFRGTHRIPQQWDGMARPRIVQILADKLMPEAPVVPAPETAAARLQENA
jgi:hypothetical protein